MRFLLFLLMFVPSVLTAQRWEAGLYHQRVKMADTLGVETRSQNNYFDGWAYLGRSKRVGVWAFAYEEGGYQSVVGGLFLDFASWLELGVGAGSESYTKEEVSNPRYAGFILLFSGRACTLEGYYESGPARDPWYQGDLLCRPVDGVGLSIFSQSGVGTGPRLLLGLSHKVPLQLWVSPFMYDFESEGSSQALGVQLVFRGRK